MALIEAYRGLDRVNSSISSTAVVALCERGAPSLEQATIRSHLSLSATRLATPAVVARERAATQQVRAWGGTTPRHPHQGGVGPVLASDGRMPWADRRPARQQSSTPTGMGVPKSPPARH